MYKIIPKIYTIISTFFLSLIFLVHHSFYLFGFDFFSWLKENHPEHMRTALRIFYSIRDFNNANVILLALVSTGLLFWKGMRVFGVIGLFGVSLMYVNLYLMKHYWVMNS